MDLEAKKVLHEVYRLNVSDAKLLRERGSRRVWYILTDQGSYCFKKYDKALDRYLFSFELQNMLVKRNSNIPRLIPTHKSHLYALDQNGRVYILFEWVNGTQPLDLQKPADLEKGLMAIAQFHRDAMTFVPSSALVHRKKYRNHISKEFRELQELKNYNEDLLALKYISYHQHIIEEAEAVLENIHVLVTSGALERETQKGYIAHNDFADINLLATKDRTYVIDLDTAAYNYPTVDVVNLYIKNCRKKLIPINDLPLWLHFYESVFPLSPILKRYLIYQLQLPTIYRRSLNRYFPKDKQDRYLELYHWEREKNKMLQRLL